MFASHYSYFGNTIKTVNLVLGLDFQHDRKLVERSTYIYGLCPRRYTTTQMAKSGYNLRITSKDSDFAHPCHEAQTYLVPRAQNI